MQKKNGLFTIGEFAKLHNVNRRTLHYYDQIGLFKPRVVGNNSYRYYTYRQSSEFEMILAFRELGMTIEDILNYYDNWGPAAFKKLLKAKHEDIKEQIHTLEAIDSMLRQKETQLNLCEQKDMNTIEIIQCDEEYLLLSDGITGENDDDDFKMLFERAACINDLRIFNRVYGSMIHVSNLKKENYQDYNYFFSQMSSPEPTDNLFLKPAGTYIRAFCKGDWDLLPKCYGRIFDFCKSHHLKLAGYAYEIGLNEMAITSMDDYVTQITIKCEKSCNDNPK